METYQRTKHIHNKSQGELAAENYLSVTSKSYTRHTSFGSERQHAQHSALLSQSYKLNRVNRHTIDSQDYINDHHHHNDRDTFHEALTTPTQAAHSQMAHDVLSDSECAAISHRLDNLYPPQAITIAKLSDANYTYDSDHLRPENVSPLNNSHRHDPQNKTQSETNDSNRSMPMNVISDESSKKILDVSRSKSASFRKSSVKNFFKHKHAKSGDNTSSPLLPPPHYYNKYDRKQREKRKRVRHKKEIKRTECDEYKGYEYHITDIGIRMRDDSVLESDYTSMYSSGSEDDAASLYKFQLKRWRQMKNMWCKCRCCLDGSYLCQCMLCLRRLWRALVYYKWLVISLSLMMWMIVLCLYSFASTQSKQSVDKYMDDILHRITEDISLNFNLNLFCHIVSVTAIILVMINVYLSILLYRMMKMNVLLLLNEAKYNKQLERVKDRRDVILLQRQHVNDLYHFSEKIWNHLLVIHENFALWIMVVQHNLKKMKKVFASDKEEAKENEGMQKKIQSAVSNLWKVHEATKLYNKEMECLILKKLKHDIEDNVNITNRKQKKRIEDVMLEHQFENFIQKIPKRYRKMFIELKQEENNVGDKAVSYDKIYILLTKLLESYRNQEEQILKSASRQSAISNKGGITVTSDRVSTEPTPISTLFGGYLQYGDDEEIESIFPEFARPRINSNVDPRVNIFYE